MNKGAINSHVIDGTALPNWVVRAAVAAVALASVTAPATRLAYGAAYGDAAVNVTLTGVHTVAARATATSASTSSVTPGLIYAGASVTTCLAYGNGAVLRDVSGAAAGDCVATGLALAADKLGEATTTAAASVNACVPHVIHPGASNSIVLGSILDASGDVTRYATSLVDIAGNAEGRAEASKQFNNQTFFYHDGYVPLAMAHLSASVLQDKMAVIVGLGTFTFGESASTANTFIRTTARATGNGASTGQTIVGTRKRFGIASATAESASTVTPTRTTYTTVNGLASADADTRPKARVRFAAAAISTAEATSYLTEFDYTAYATASAESTAFLVSTTFGKQTLGTSIDNSFSYGYGGSVQRFAGAATGLAVSILSRSTFGSQVFGLMQATGTAQLSSAQTIHQHAGRVSAMAQASLVQSTQGNQAFGLVQATATATLPAGLIVANKKFMADASALAAVTGTASGVTNADVLAPYERMMIVPDDDRTMIIPNEDRLMVSV